MNKRLLFTMIALCAGAFAHAAPIVDAPESSFVAPTIEHFKGTPTDVASYDFLNGMTYKNLGQADHINFDGNSFVDGNTSVSAGYDDGDGDVGYFATGDAITPTSFEFSFASGVTRFGFHGIASVDDGASSTNGIVNIEFFDMNNISLMLVPVDTGSFFSWYDFYGFESTSGPIGRVVFNNVNKMVLDNVTFEGAAAVPEPASIALFGLGLAGFAAARRKTARK
ncbi:MAG: PEP-CTERM sorting domain-containing protein [Pseudomonadota bacterium]|nr:PEP-CTERM sorting domain-containing protein [Pseudomonadota bacterium]